MLKAAQMAGHTVVGTYRRHPEPGLVHLDSADSSAADALLRTQRPDVVIHAAGWTWVDGCEDDPAKAFAENAEQPARLAEQCRKSGCRFAYFSSSYVFDGKAGPYGEDAMPNPINVYGRSKLRAERDIQAAHDEALLLRVVCVYGAEEQGKNFAYQVRRAMESGQVLKLPEDQCGNPTEAGDLSRWLLELLQRGATGVWHLAGPWPDCTRVHWAERLVSAFEAAGVRRHPQFSINAVPTAQLEQRAMRPLKAGLLTPKADALGLRPTEFDKTVLEMVRADNNR
jgi:dTDP-4-dehydrorhamnose reductase